MVMVIGCGVWGLSDVLRFARGFPDLSLKQGDPVDSVLIVHGLERATGLRQTLAWFTAPWVGWTGHGSYNAFYRPLTSVVWRLEYSVFGPRGLLGFMAVHAMLHLLVLLVALLFLRRLLGLRIATVAVCLFALRVPDLWFGLPDNSTALFFWKDDPDLWCSLWYLAGAWCFVEFLTTDCARWFVATVACFAVALGFKEMAYSFPLFLLLLLWVEGRMRERWRAVAAVATLAASAYVYRYWALGGGGFHVGSNHSWLVRWAIHVGGGRTAAAIVNADALPSCVATFLLALGWRRCGGTWRVQCVAAVAFVILLALTAWRARGDEYPFYYALLGSEAVWWDALMALVLFVLVSRWLENGGRGQWFGWLWVVVTYVPLIFSYTTEHTSYFVAMGWCVWLAYGLCDLCRIVWHHPSVVWWRRRLTSPRLAVANAS